MIATNELKQKMTEIAKELDTTIEFDDEHREISAELITTKGRKIWLHHVGYKKQFCITDMSNERDVNGLHCSQIYFSENKKVSTIVKDIKKRFLGLFNRFHDAIDKENEKKQAQDDTDFEIACRICKIFDYTPPVQHKSAIGDEYKLHIYTNGCILDFTLRNKGIHITYGSMSAGNLLKIAKIIAEIGS